MTALLIFLPAYLLGVYALYREAMNAPFADENEYIIISNPSDAPPAP
jgi:hypothetical protein